MQYVSSAAEKLSSERDDHRDILPMDHTSILQLIAERFGADGEDYSPSVRRRKDAGINSVSMVLDAAVPDRATPQAPPVSLDARVTISTLPSNPKPTDSQASFATAAQQMIDKHGKDAKDAYPELAHFAATTG